LFEVDPQRTYPCADCPYPLDEVNADAWQLFCEAGKRTTSQIDKKTVDVFDIDWGLVRLMIEVRDYPDAEALIRKLLALQRSLNG
jgi:hypothetical protein